MKERVSATIYGINFEYKSFSQTVIAEIAKYLQQNPGIQSSSLTGKAVDFLSPKASNIVHEGKAINRGKELVRKNQVNL